MSAAVQGGVTALHPLLVWFARGVEDGTREALCFIDAQEAEYWHCVAYYSCNPTASPEERAVYIEGFVCGSTGHKQTSEVGL